MFKIFKIINALFSIEKIFEPQFMDGETMKVADGVRGLEKIGAIIKMGQ